MLSSPLTPNLPSLQKFSVWSSLVKPLRLRCYEPEEEFRENIQDQIAPVESSIGAIGTLTVFTQLLHGLIDSQFIS